MKIRREKGMGKEQGVRGRERDEWMVRVREKNQSCQGERERERERVVVFVRCEINNH